MDSLRLRLTGLPPQLSARGRALLSRTLSVSAAELDRLPAALPLEVVLGPRGAAQARPLGEGLAREGVVAAASPASTPFSPCSLHPQLLESDVCPSCNARGCPACVRLSGDRRCARCRTTQARWTTFRRVRIAILLAVLVIVAAATLLDRRRIASWDGPVRVVVHPIAAEPAPAVSAYADALGDVELAPIAAFLDAEARRHGRTIEPRAIELVRGARLHELPPAIPEDPGPIAAITWSLSLRWWATRTAWSHDLETADARLFLVIHEATPGRTVEHSAGLEKGRVGVVKLFASADVAGLNAVVLAHELLHTLGATDKYGPGGQPLVPDGLADAAAGFPQARAELMAGSVALSSTEARLPVDLGECTIGPATAREVGWLASP